LILAFWWLRSCLHPASRDGPRRDVLFLKDRLEAMRISISKRVIRRVAHRPTKTFAAMLLLIAAEIHAATVTEAWVHRYSNSVSNANDVGLEVLCDPSGDIIVVGTTYITEPYYGLTLK